MANSAVTTLSAAWMKGPGMNQSTSKSSFQVVAIGGAAVLVASAAAAAYTFTMPLFGTSKTDETKEAHSKETEKDEPRVEPRNAFSSVYRVASEGASAAYDAAATATDSASVAYGAAADAATEGISATRSLLKKAAEPLAPRNPTLQFFDNVGKGFDEFGKNVERAFTGKNRNKSNDTSMVVYSRPKENPAAEFFDNVGKGFMGMFGN